MKKIKVALGLSGGVDSAVSAYLLKKQGFDVSCVYLNCFDSDTPGCRGDQDRKDALAVAMHLGLPFQVLDFRKEYQAAVIDYFKKEYLLGRTPNPDVICNRDIKFGLFLDWAVKAGFDYLATGHYAKIERNDYDGKDGLDGKDGYRVDNNPNTLNTLNHLLLCSKDLHKDQTYFLWAVPRQKFSRVLFPLGNLLKTEVREIALKIGLPVAKKKDSTGICFVGEVRVEDFLKRLGVKEKIGEVVIRKKMADNHFNPFDHYQIIGSHRGVWFYTIGQRHGFEITSWPPCHPERSEAESRDLAAGDKNIASLDSSTSSLRSVARNDGVTDRPPLYVIEKDIKKNRLIVGFGAETYRNQFVVSDTNWLVSKKARPFWKRPGLNKFKCLVRIRHGGELIPCSVVSSPLSVVSSKSAGFQSAGSGQINRQPITVFLSIPQRGIAPGQSAVFYLPRSPWRNASAKPGRSGAKAGSKNGIVLGGGVIQ